MTHRTLTVLAAATLWALIGASSVPADAATARIPMTLSASAVPGTVDFSSGGTTVSYNGEASAYFTGSPSYVQTKLAAKATQIGSFSYSVRILATVTTECWSRSALTATYTTTLSTPFQYFGVTTTVGPYSYPCPIGSTLYEKIVAHAQESSGGSTGDTIISIGPGIT